MENINNINLENTEHVIDHRRELALQGAETNIQAANNYLNLATQNTNDGQNVHDTSVLANFKMIVERLRLSQHDDVLDNSVSIEDIEKEIKKHGREFSENRPSKTIEVLEVIDKLRQGEKIASLDLTDEECLRLVWNRANHQLNVENCKKIKQAIFDNLADCWEADLGAGLGRQPLGLDGAGLGAANLGQWLLGNIDGNIIDTEQQSERKIVCVTGRVTRILSSLMLLDFDPKNWEVKKLEQFKNEIFENVRIIIDDEAQKALLSEDEYMQNAGKALLAKTQEELSAVGKVGDANEQLNIIIKESIVNMINTFEEKNIISKKIIDSIKQEALVAVDML
jgi:hypothetical protein